MQRKILAAAALALFALQTIPAQAAKLYLSEYGAVGRSIYAEGGSSGVLEIAQEPSLQQTPVDFSGGSASSSAFGRNTRFIRIVCDASCSYSVTTSAGTATANNALLPAGVIEYLGVQAGSFINVHSNP